MSSCSGETSFAKVMSQSANELNKSCPMMVDKDTRLDNAIAIDDKILLLMIKYFNIITL